MPNVKVLLLWHSYSGDGVLMYSSMTDFSGTKDELMDLVRKESEEADQGCIHPILQQVIPLP